MVAYKPILLLILLNTDETMKIIKVVKFFY